jgi:alpha-glucosidase
MEVVLRAYDDGVAFRYRLPEVKGQAVSSGELSSFNFAGDYTAWFYNGENHNLGPEPLSAVSGIRLPVMTVRAGHNAYLAVHEADLRSGEPMRLSKSGPTAFIAVAARGGVVSGFESPWRVIFYGRKPGSLVDSHLLELLSPPAVGDFSWAEPGLAVWDWRIDGAQIDGFKYEMSLPSWIRMVDFAADNGFRYLVLDANWYGPEFEQESDPVKGEKASAVRKIIDYGKQRKVGIWLYLNDIGGQRFPLDETLAEYARWGARGVKYGFMRGTPEEENALTRRITELCAKHRLLCNFHDHPVHPHGQMRTWPNAVTREYNQAQLDAKKVFGPKTFVTATFVNMLAGPLDMNNGMFDLRQGPTTRVDNNMEVPSTVVSEAARTLITFSGVTILPDIPEFYQKYPGLLSFLSAQKMPWRESRTLDGEIGSHIVVARQAADRTWLVGAATDETPRTLEVKLDFLQSGIFEALVVEDGDDAHYLRNRESINVARRKVSAADVLKVRLAAGGGACVILRPLVD